MAALPEMLPSRRPMLTAAEERDLARRRDAGDADALAELVTRNLPLVHRLSWNYPDCGVDREDLIQAGSIGLLTAARQFDPDRGRFTTVAYWWVRQAMTRSVHCDAPVVHTPCHVAVLIPRWRRAERDLAEATGRPPADAEVAASLGLPARVALQVADGIRARRCLSLADPADPESPDIPLAALVEDGREARADTAATAAEDLARVVGLLARLPDRDAEIVRRRYGLGTGRPETLREIGDALCLTKERVRQICERALDHLRGLLAGRAVPVAGGDEPSGMDGTAP